MGSCKMPWPLVGGSVRRMGSHLLEQPRREGRPSEGVRVRIRATHLAKPVVSMLAVLGMAADWEACVPCLVHLRRSDTRSVREKRWGAYNHGNCTSGWALV